MALDDLQELSNIMEEDAKLSKSSSGFPNNTWKNSPDRLDSSQQLSSPGSPSRSSPSGRRMSGGSSSQTGADSGGTRKAALRKDLPISKKTEFYFLPPEVEKQLVDSRLALEKRKKAFDATFYKFTKEVKKPSFK